MNPAHVRFIYFDLDDTLLDHRRAERAGLADLCQAFAEHFDGVDVEAVQETYHTHSVPLWRQYAHGEIGKADVQRLRFERTMQSLGLSGPTAQARNDAYLDCYARHWTFPDEARDAFHALADAFPVGILTNGFAEIQHAKFERFPELRRRTEAVVISEEVGVMKPHPKIFAHAAERAGVPPEALLYVGDSYTSDVEGARGARWQAAWHTSEEQPAPDDVFRFQRWEVLTERLSEGS